MGTPTTVLVVLFSILFMQVLEFSYSIASHSNVSCIESEQKALVKFRESLTDKSNRLSSWVGEDCCTWKGVVCNNKTGHVLRLNLRNPTLPDDWPIFESWANFSKTFLGGEISPSLLNLKHLSHLDLSMNNFSGTQIPKFLGSLQNLRYLNLSNSGFQGNIPHHLGNLSSLRYLNLSDSLHYALTVDNLLWVSKLSSLKHLDISYVSIDKGTDWLQPINMLSSLSILKLTGCRLYTIPPLSYVNFTSLSSLDLRDNGFDSTIPLWLSNITGLLRLHLDGNQFHGPIPYTLGRLSSLTHIGLSENSFDTSVPSSLGNLSSLVHLDLSSNAFQGSLQTTIKNLCRLRVLDLSRNNFSGEIPSLEGGPFDCHKNLERLLLFWNSFHGPIPMSIGRLSRLRELDVSDNQLTGSIPSSLGQLSKLEILDVSGNQLNGSIPSSLGQLSKLETLDVSYNYLAGMVSEYHFTKLTRLNKLFMSFNFLALNVSSQWIPPFQLQYIHLASSNLGPLFPSWLQTQTRVKSLVMSNASVSDTIPDWFENVYSRILYLDLSMNRICGKLPKFEESKNSIWTDLKELILKSNRFNGPLTMFPSDVINLDLSDNLLSGHIPMIKDAVNLKLEGLILSNNQLSGEIPSFLCNVKTMIFIDLSRNQLSGRLPKCLGFWQDLWFLDVTNNSLHGEIPSTLGSLRKLVSLHLRDNRFCGKLPLSLQNLTDLTILDLGKNAFTGIIPPWIGKKLSTLEFLNLQSNKFHGDIPPQICWLSELRLLNVAQNSITGNVPHCFGNFTAMVKEDPFPFFETRTWSGPDYKEYIMDSITGIERKYTAAIDEHTSIDLSNNNINGEIPEELMNLSRLWKLNLAGNHLKGRIPETIGNLKRLESLDLSKNELSGSIPSGLSDLNFLSNLNLSFNNLSGRIPKGNQLQTLDDQSIYMGNSELCGAPLLKSCPGDKPVEDHDQQVEAKCEDSSKFLWFYAGIGPGFVVGFLAVCCTLLFKKSWRYAYFGLIENVYNRLLLASALTSARLRKKFRKGEFGA